MFFFAKRERKSFQSNYVTFFPGMRRSFRLRSTTVEKIHLSCFGFAQRKYLLFGFLIRPIWILRFETSYLVLEIWNLRFKHIQGLKIPKYL
jgi:hypothetical protein